MLNGQYAIDIKTSATISQTQQTLQTIRSVKGFDPSELVTRYGDLKEGKVTLVFKADALLAWARLYWPDFCISSKSFAFDPNTAKGVAVIFRNQEDSRPIVETEAYRTKSQYERFLQRENPGMPLSGDEKGYFEWAQKAAVSKALLYAGFGLTADFVGDVPESIAANAGQQSNTSLDSEVSNVISMMSHANVKEHEEPAAEPLEVPEGQQRAGQPEPDEPTGANDIAEPAGQEQATPAAADEKAVPETMDQEIGETPVQEAAVEEKPKRMSAKRANATVFISEKYPDGITIGELYETSAHFVRWLSKDLANCGGDEEIYKAVSYIIKKSDEQAAGERSQESED